MSKRHPLLDSGYKTPRPVRAPLISQVDMVARIESFRLQEEAAETCPRCGSVAGKAALMVRRCVECHVLKSVRLYSSRQTVCKPCRSKQQVQRNRKKIAGRAS